jgi:hypothetical protein
MYVKEETSKGYTKRQEKELSRILLEFQILMKNHKILILNWKQVQKV